jgi:hypothetical protein
MRIRVRCPRPIAVLLVASLLGAAGCSVFDGVYYGTMERFGKEKRDLLVDRVAGARDSQEETKEQFKNALEQFSALVGFDGGELEEVYNRLEREYERSQDKANDVRDRIESVEDVAGDLFKEWSDELNQYQNQDLRRMSEQRRDAAQDRYDEMIEAMRRAEAKMHPVLEAFEDQVLVLKHDLNARAISSLEGRLETLETDIASLIVDMNRSIEEADLFIEQMQA